MITDYVLLNIVIAELIIVLLLLLALILRRVVFYTVDQLGLRRKQAIADRLIMCVGHGIVTDALLQYPGCLDSKKLLCVMEEFNRRFKGEEWKALKERILQIYLLPRARGYINSFFWRRRNFAIRCFTLAPMLEDESSILQLLDDPVFLVRSVAAVAGIALESSEAIRNILVHMSQSTGYARCFYKDILSQGSPTVLTLIIHSAMHHQNADVHLATLEILSTRMSMEPLEFLQKDLKSRDSKVRLLALKASMNNPYHSTLSLLLESLKDPSEEVRIEAVRNLEKFGEKQTFHVLKKILNEQSLPMRLQAAYTLKNMGKEGVDLLREQEVKGSQESCALAQYVLQFE